ncbi:MAG: hypothetical protein IJ048_02580 [Clostridia bacterium]|nr:hypothetical protein [Clostridia bacterium]
MSRGYGYYRRRSIFRPDAGRAFLRFLIGIVLLIGLCCAFYLFVLQGTVSVNLPIQEERKPTAEPTVTVTQTPTPVPTIEPTAEPPATPTPVPTATPIPREALAGTAELPPPLSEQPDAGVELGLKELSLFDEAGQSVVIVRGYAYAQGKDAAQSHSYALLIDPITGDTLGTYPVTPRPEEADLSFDEAAGSNLDQAFFHMNIDVSALPDGYYIVCMAVENGGSAAWNYFDDSMYHFRIEQGVAVLGE